MYEGPAVAFKPQGPEGPWSGPDIIVIISSSHVFVPAAVETLGPLADEAQLFLAEISKRATLCAVDPREATFLYQRISVAIRSFNAVCLANSLTVSESPS